MKIIRFISDNRYRLFKTILAYFAYFCIGSATTLLGSSLLDLQIRLNVDFAKVSYLIPFRSAGHILGSALAGLIEQRFNRSLLLWIINLISGIFLGAAPFFTKFEFTSIFLVIAGVAHGMSDILCNTSVTSTWKEKSTNWLQVLHMSWGIGSLLTPVICRPFLLPEESLEPDSSALITANTTADPMIVSIYTAKDVMIQYAFVIIGLLSVIVSFFYACIYFRERSITEYSKKEVNAVNIQVPQPSSQISPWKKYIAIFLVAVVGHLCYSLEAVLGSLGASFSVKSDLHMDKKTGVLLATVFWSCFSFYRLIFIPLTFIVAEAKLLAFSLLLTLLGVVVSVPWANNNEACLWAGFTLVGLGLSTIFSSSLGMLSRYIVITGQISSMIFIPGVVGELFHPAIAATLLANSPILYLYYNAALGVVLVISFLALMIYCKTVLKTPTVHIAHPSIGPRFSTLSVSHH
uniref:Major facilitator superfamily (MFS) profile domain-containing protein n=2 Tax=Tetranychus urticae TaxID=32264 RepID=T1KTN7_TETUR